jgi:two-component system NarL family response regulator
MRILVADDYADWRAKVRVIVGYRPQWQIIDEACDGEEAVEKAAQLKPDIVILDLSMPRLNGIEAAKLIQQRSSSTRVVFLSENLDTDIQQAALNVGHAYVLKSSAARELIPAIERVQAAAASGQESDSINSRN